jgi:hypothetical protein
MPDFASAYWKVSLPQEWSGRNDAECATFVRPGGPGALQISAARKDSEVTDDDLRDFAREHLENGAKTKAVTTGDFCGFTFQYRDDENYWRQWFVRHGPFAVFVTYNCPVAAYGEESATVESIVTSLRAQPEAL